ncbi:hypothetical protein BHM03_00007694 [Ensete ventricosum]|nr:hypothetical protein BHM03_00007694 [Ensete ventricosum]
MWHDVPCLPMSLQPHILRMSRPYSEGRQRPLCASSPAVVLGRSRCSTLWMDPSYPVTGLATGVVELGSGGGTSGAEAYIVSAVGHPYLATLLPLWLIMSWYPSTKPTVLAVLTFVLTPNLATFSVKKEMENAAFVLFDPFSGPLQNGHRFISCTHRPSAGVAPSLSPPLSSMSLYITDTGSGDDTGDTLI